MDGITRDAVTASSVVDAAAAGDAIAFARLVAAYHADMIRVAFVVSGGDQDAADDAVQAAWAIAWQKLVTLRQRDRVRPWLVAVAANEARRLGRRGRALHRVRAVVRSETLVDDSSGPDPADRTDVLDLERALHDLTVIENEGGSWEGPCTGAGWGDGDRLSCWLTGTGAYAGLTYYYHSKRVGRTAAAVDEGVILPLPAPGSAQ